ncbi:MAG: hypothetical protein FJX72_06865, partial [Armatimonadetes bacterium]|nr:hypothetical protein [Armatimonadota bacterium]
MSSAIVACSTRTRKAVRVGVAVGLVVAAFALYAGARSPDIAYLPHEIAPPVESPSEPPTRTLNTDEARRALETDWLFQAEGRPLAARALQEVRWAREMAERVRTEGNSTALDQELNELDRLGSRLRSLPHAEHTEPPRRTSPRPTGLAGLWTFDETDGDTVRDASGDGRDAVADGWLAREPGVSGNAASLVGGGSLTAKPPPSCVGRGAYTVCAWIKTTSQEADILGTGVGLGHFLFMTYRGVVRAHHWTVADGNVLDGKTRVADGRWHHVVATLDGSVIRVYVDGRLDAERPFVGKPEPVTSPMTIGGRGPTTSSSAFSGTLDDLALYDRALTEAEIARESVENPLPVAAGSQAAGDETARRLYLEVREVKRRIFLMSPEVDFDTVLFIDQPYPAGSEWPHQARHRNGMMAIPGGRLLKLRGLHPGGEVAKLAPPRPGSFWSPDVSFDGKRVLFCWKPWDDPAFHLYEIGADGQGLRQLTSGPYDDMDPVYLPDGHIAFVSSRCNSYVRCMPYTFSYVLARCDADGRNVYLISQNSEPDWCPTVLNDGRLIYSRWEYTDKALWRIQSLWTTNPDGTGTATFWGNQSVWPDHLAEPRAIPGSSRVMFTGLAHHDWFAGSIGIVDPGKGRNFPLGLTKVTCEVPWPECGKPPVDPRERPDYHTSGRFTAYKTPYPL